METEKWIRENDRIENKEVALKNCTLVQTSVHIWITLHTPKKKGEEKDFIV